jgi:hypothetical protein
MLAIITSLLLAGQIPGPPGNLYFSNQDLRAEDKETGHVALYYPSGLTETQGVTPAVLITLQAQRITLFQVGALAKRPAQFIRDLNGVLIEVRIN